MKQRGVGTGLPSTNKFSLRHGWETRLATTFFCQNIPAKLRSSPKLYKSCLINEPNMDSRRKGKLENLSGSLFLIIIPLSTILFIPLYPYHSPLTDIYGSQVGALAGKHSVFQMSAQHISPQQDQTCTLPWSRASGPSFPHPIYTHTTAIHFKKKLINPILTNAKIMWTICLAY